MQLLRYVDCTDSAVALAVAGSSGKEKYKKE
jgi:hypothetical protein